MPVCPSPLSVARRPIAALAAIGLLALALDRALAVPLPAGASGLSALLGTTPSHLVVSEVMTGGSSASDEFIELYNPMSSTQPLEGLEVVYVTSTGATVTRKAAWATGAAGLPAGAHLLMANSAGIFAGLADVTYANGLAAAGGSVALRIQGAATAIDAVGWGTAASTWLETRPAPAPAAGSSLERLPGGGAGSTQDADDSLIDFAVQTVPDPQNSGSPPIVLATPTPMPTESAPPSATPEASASPTVEATPTPTPSESASPTASPSDTPTPTPSPWPTPTPSPSPTPTASPTPTPAPISIAAARSLPDGTSVVVVEGIALTDSAFTDGGGYLTDGTAGIAVLLSDGTFARGQMLRVAGTVDDRYSQRTIRTSAAQIIPLGVGSEPLPTDVDTGSVGETVEGQLVELTGLITSSATTLSNGVAWDLDDGTGPIRVLIGSATGIDTTGWGRGVGVTLVGVVGQRDSSGSGTAGYRVQPRDATDLIEVEPAATPTPTPTPSPTPTPEPMATPGATDTATPSPSPSPTPSPTATAAGVPLASIGEARAAAPGTHLRIRGVVTAPSGLLEAGSAVVQDSSGAILVRLGSKAGSLLLGQFVELDGVRSTKAGMLTLRVVKPALRLGTLADPTPIRKATGALREADEAKVVITRSMVSSAVSRPRGGAVSFSIDDGSGAIRVTLSPRSGIATGTVKRGSWLELRGVLGQETTSKAPLKGYRLWPRVRSDLVVIAAPVAGAAANTSCCAHGGSTPAPLTGGHPRTDLVTATIPWHGIPPVLARPQPTFAASSPITGMTPSPTGRRVPREAGLIVSGIGLAALAGLAAWLGRRRRRDRAQLANAPGSGTREGGDEPAIPHLSLLRVDAEESPEGRRILPPT